MFLGLACWELNLGYTCENGPVCPVVACSQVPLCVGSCSAEIVQPGATW